LCGIAGGISQIHSAPIKGDIATKSHDKLEHEEQIFSESAQTEEK
jgi:hypothetical protein